MSGELIHINSSDWLTARGWIQVPVSLPAVPDLVSRAIASSDRFSIFEMQADGAILASRTTFTSRALRTNLHFDEVDAGLSRISARCTAANPLGWHRGLEYREDAVREILQSLTTRIQH